MKVYTHSLQGRRESNEDQHSCILNLNEKETKLNDINFFAVFDGHGGKCVSKYLKDNLPHFFTSKFNKSIYTNNELATKYFNKVYDKIQSNMIKHHPRAVQYCGSTACVGIHYKDSNFKDKLWILNVGDSRAIKYNKHNIAVQLSIDHKPNNPTERQRIKQLGGKIEFDGSDWRIKNLSLSRAFGDIECTPYVTHLPQIYNYRISQDDKFIIFACDGLWDVLSNQQVGDYINKLLNDPKYKGNYAKDLVEYAYMKGSLDNISCIVYLLH
jgi:serine/threonine protein phosphatase PrpC